MIAPIQCLIRVVCVFSIMQFTVGAAVGQSGSETSGRGESASAAPTSPPTPTASSAPESQPPAGAPEATPDLDPTALSRSDYDAGKLLFENGDYAGALVKLKRAYELSHDHRVLWNMIVCEKQMRHYSRMQSLIQQYLKEGGAQLAQGELDQGQRLLESIQPFIGELKLEIDQPGATAVLDGEHVGVTPLRDAVLLDLGTHELRITKSGFEARTIPLQISGAGVLPIYVKLKRIQGTAHLIVTGPQGSTVFLDHSVVGREHWEGMVDSGTHQVQVTAANAKPYNLELLLEPQETRRLSVSLEPETPHHLWWWIAGGALVAGGLVVGVYALSAHDSKPAAVIPPAGTLGSVVLPLQ